MSSERLSNRKRASVITNLNAALLALILVILLYDVTVLRWYGERRLSSSPSYPGWWSVGRRATSQLTLPIARRFIRAHSSKQVMSAIVPVNQV